MSVIEQKNYLILAEDGKVYNYYKNSFAEVLSAYAESNSISTACTIANWSDFTAMCDQLNTLYASDYNKIRINFFNAICPLTGYRIKQVVYNFSIAYWSPTNPSTSMDSDTADGFQLNTTPETLNNFFIVNEAGNVFGYAKDATISGVDAALTKYLTDVISLPQFGVSREIWQSILASINKLTDSSVVPAAKTEKEKNRLLIEALNSLCKNSQHKIKAFCINANFVYDKSSS